MVLNCWEFKKCGQCQDSASLDGDTNCPVPGSVDQNGTNRGKNAGRYCWRVAGTFCGGEVQGTYAKKLQTCIECDFFNKVQEEEGPGFMF